MRSTFSVINVKIYLCTSIFVLIVLLTYSTSPIYAKFTCDENTGKCVPAGTKNTPSGSNETGNIGGNETGPIVVNDTNQCFHDPVLGDICP